jgi:hypothetical protein
MDLPMWNDLSMKEKAAMMKVAIKNGITNLDSIREEYNKFAMGGPEGFNKAALGGNLFDLGGEENQGLGNIPLKDIPLGIWWLTGQNQSKPFEERQSISDYLNEMETLAANRKRDEAAYKVNPEAGNIIMQAPTKNLKAERGKIAAKYSIPYKEENRLNLTTGRFNTGYTTTDVLDAIYNAAKNTGTDFSTALGLAARESGLGYARNFEKNGNITMTDLYSNWNQIHPILNDNKAVENYHKLRTKYNNKIPLSDSEIKFMSEYVKKWNKEVDSIHDINENPIENAFKYYSTGEYNKNKEHSKLVQKEGALLLTDPAIQKWAKQRGYTFAEGGFVSPEGDDEETLIPIEVLMARNAEASKAAANFKAAQALKGQANATKQKDQKDKVTKEVEFFQNALNSFALNPDSLSKGIKIASQKQVQEKQERWKEDKENIDKFMNALETATALYGIGRGATKLLNLEGSSNKYLSWIGKNIDLPQGIMNSVGAVADGYQLLAGTTPWDRVENGVELTGDIAGIIGATNWLRRTPLFGRYSKAIDTALDVTGYSAAGWDLFKNTPWGEKVENYLGNKVNNYFGK